MSQFANLWLTVEFDRATAGVVVETVKTTQQYEVSEAGCTRKHNRRLYSTHDPKELADMIGGRYVGHKVKPV